MYLTVPPDVQESIWVRLGSDTGGLGRRKLQMMSAWLALPGNCAAPCRLDHTLTQGIISGLGRELATPGAAWHQVVDLVLCHAVCLAEVTLQ